jgi:hypothetical protein
MKQTLFLIFIIFNFINSECIMKGDKVLIWKIKTTTFQNITYQIFDGEFSGKGRNGYLVFGTSKTNSSLDGKYIFASLQTGLRFEPNNSQTNIFMNASITVDPDRFSELNMFQMKITMFLTDLSDYLILAAHSNSPLETSNGIDPMTFQDFDIFQVNLLEKTRACRVYEPAIVEALHIGKRENPLTPHTGVSIPIMILYILLFILCLAFSQQQPLKSRGFTPFMILIAFYSIVTSQLFFFSTTVEWRNYYFCYVVGLLDASSLQISNFLMLFNFTRFVFITFLNNEKFKLTNEKKNATTFFILKWFNFLSSPVVSVVFIIGCLLFFWSIIVLSNIPFENEGVCTSLQTAIYSNVLIGFGFIALFFTILVQCLDVGLNGLVVMNPYKFYFIHDPFYFRLESATVPLLFLFIILSNVLVSVVPTIRWITILVNSISLYWVLFIQCIFVLGVTIYKSIYRFLQCGQRKNLHTQSDFYECLNHPNLKIHFKIFCKQEWSLENYLIWNDLQEWKKLKSVEKRKEMAMEIYETYLQVGSSLEVNITRVAANEVKKDLDEDSLEEDTFRGILILIENNLSDTYSRFIHTKEYLMFEKKKNEKRLAVEEKSMAETALEL